MEPDYWGAQAPVRLLGGVVCPPPSPAPSVLLHCVYIEMELRVRKASLQCLSPTLLQLNIEGESMHCAYHWMDFCSV